MAVVADIEAKFHQFKVPKHDRDALRILWWRDSFEEAPATYHVTRHFFGATDSPRSCTYGLRRCAMDNKGDFDSRVAETVQRNLYVDDLLKSFRAEEEAIELCLQLVEEAIELCLQLVEEAIELCLQLVEEAIELCLQLVEEAIELCLQLVEEAIELCLQLVEEAIELCLQLVRMLRRAELRLTEFLSNSKKVLAALPEPERAADCKNLDREHLPTEPALGVRWDIAGDTLGITATSMDDVNTRR